MNKIYFATSNKNKIREAESILNIKIEPISLEIKEIQSLDIREVALEKAKKYYEKIKKPLFVEDGGIVLRALKKLPGAYTSDFLKTIGNQGIVKLVGKDRRAYAEVVICYIQSAGRINVFSGKVNGSIAEKPLGTTNFGWDPIFIPKGETKTFAQMTLAEKNKYSMRAKALIKLKNHLKVI